MTAIKFHTRRSKLGGQWMGVPFPTGTQHFPSPQRPETVGPTQPLSRVLINLIAVRITTVTVRLKNHGVIPQFSHTSS